MHKRVGAVENAIAILDLLSISRSGLRLVDISERLEMNNSTCLSILRTLMHHDAVRLDAATRRYSIGGYISRLNELIVNKSRTERIAFKRMADLARTFDVISTLWHRTNDWTLTLEAVFESERDMRIATQLGLSRPIYFGSIGRMYAACVNPPEAELRKACLNYNWANSPSPDTFLAEIQLARERGWALDYSNAISGMCSVTVPVREADGSVLRLCSAGMFLVTYDDPQKRAAILDGLFAIQREFEQTENSA